MRILVGRPDVVETASDARRMVCTVLQSVERPGSARRARAGPQSVLSALYALPRPYHVAALLSHWLE